MTQLEKHIYGLDKKVSQMKTQTDLDRLIYNLDARAKQLEKKELQKAVELVRIQVLIDISKLNDNTYFCNQLTKIKEYIKNN
jgi:hypothetical protein